MQKNPIRFYLKIIFSCFGFYPLLGCVTTLVTVPENPSGEWQRPLDLQLHKKNKVKKIKAENPVKSPLDDVKKYAGSLNGIKIKVDCSSSDFESKDQFSLREKNMNLGSSYCELLTSELEEYGATTLNSSTGLFDLEVRLLMGENRRISCGMFGWLTYFSLGLFPCKTNFWWEGELQILDPNKVVLVQSPLFFHRIQYFGWYALMIQGAAHTLEKNQLNNLSLYAINKVYTLAVQKKIIEWHE